LTIIIPETLLPSFQDFLQSALSISRYIKTQINVQKAIQKASDESYQIEQQKHFEKYSASVLSKFDKFIESGLPVRQAIRQTKEVLNQGGFDLTCSLIELMARSTGRLSKRKEGKKNVKQTQKIKGMGKTNKRDGRKSHSSV
jgi:hypothetical protein